MSSLETLRSTFTQHIPLAKRACGFLTSSPDPFHVVENCISQLRASGFEEAGFTHHNKTKNNNNSSSSSNNNNNNNNNHNNNNNTATAGTGSATRTVLEPGGKYYYKVNNSALVAFAIGEKFVPGRGGFHIVGGHTDSPNIRVKPYSKKTNKGSCIRLNVSCYGGGLWHTWFDRDLAISGQVLVRDKDQRLYSHRLLNITDPIARIPTLGIHLSNAEERKAFAVNPENHTSPMIATTTSSTTTSLQQQQQQQTILETCTEQQLLSSVSSSGGQYEDQDDPWLHHQEPLLLEAIAEELRIHVDQIADFELSLYDAQPASLGGIANEFLYSARLDNLATVFCSLEALIHHSNHHLKHDSDVAVIVHFDHEEVGSESSHGAGSPMIQQAIQRILYSTMDTTTTNTATNYYDWNQFYDESIRKSFCLSVDQAHAIHPNYASKHESYHRPKLNHGIVIKNNVNQKYTTNRTTAFIIRELARNHSHHHADASSTTSNPIPIQEFVVRNDMGCGSTIGPRISALTGIRTIDLGMAQLSMHSIREVMGIADLTYGLELLQTFFQNFRELDDQLQNDYGSR